MSLKTALNTSHTEHADTDQLSTVADIILLLDNASIEELKELRASLKAFGADFSTRTGQRRIAKNVLALVNKELNRI